MAVFPLAPSIRQHWLWRGVPTWIEGDLDTGLIHFGVTNAPNFLDTFAWWVGTWAGLVPFYRPLSSYVFWVEWKLFGDREWLYLIPTVAAHILACCVFVLLVIRLARRWQFAYPLLTGILAAALFTRLLCPEVHYSVWWVAILWKNQPDSFATVFCCLSLLAYDAAQERGSRFPWAALLLYLTACCFKEIAVPLPGVCLALEAVRLHGSERRPAVLRIVTLGVGGLLFLAWRRWALGGVGYLYGSNHAWLFRTIVHGLGPFGELANGLPSGPLVAIWAAVMIAFTVWLFRRPRFRNMGTVAILGLAFLLVGLFVVGWGIIGAGRSVHVSLPASSGPGSSFVTRCLDYWAVGLLVTLDGAPLSMACQCLLCLGVGWVLWTRRREPLLVGVIWLVLFVLPLTLSPGPVHRYYLSEMGLALVYAFGFSEAIILGIEWARPRLVTLRRQSLRFESPSS